MNLTRRTLLQGTAALAATAATSRMSFAQSDASGSLRLAGFGGDAETAAITHAIGRFNKKYPNVTVDLQMDPISTGWGDYVTKVLGQFTAGDTADIYGTAIETFEAFASRGLWMPLDDFVKSNSGFSDFAPSLFQLSSYKGHVMYVPISWNNIMVNYNTEHFKTAGIDKPDGWTWDQFRAAAKKLTIKDSAGNVTQWGYEVPNQNFFIQPWFFSNGSSGALNADWSGSNMLDPKVAESLQFLHDLIHVDGVSPIPATDTMDNQFFAGQVSMISRGHWIVQGCKQNNVPLDIAIPPKKVSDTTVLGFGGYAINKDTKNADLAKALMLELVSLESQTEEGDGGGGVPGRKSALSQTFLSFPPSADLYYKTLDNVKAVPSPANFQEVEKIFIRHYIAMMADEVSIADGCKQADAELNDSFARLKSQS